jgi:hypothetical protein
VILLCIGVNVTLNLHTHPLFSAHHASDAFQKKLESILKRQKQEEEEEEDPGITTTLALACLARPHLFLAEHYHAS